MRTRQRMARIMCAVALAVSSATIGAQTTNRAGSRTEGIKVHGHWTIDVRNPDGSLVSHHEFENALTASGIQQLANILAGRRAPGGWVIRIAGQGGPCLNPVNGSARACIMFEPPLGLTPDNSETFSTLVVVPRSGVELSASSTATASGSLDIRSVDTWVESCPSNFTPSNCMAVTGLVGPGQPLPTFTSHTLAAPIALSTGQIVQVKVVISFS